MSIGALMIGGERGIRTLDTLLTYTPLAGARLQPLGHFSINLFNRHSLTKLVAAPGRALLRSSPFSSLRDRPTCVQNATHFVSHKTGHFSVKLSIWFCTLVAPET